VRRIQIIDERRRHSRKHRRSAGEQEQRDDDERQQARDEFTRRIEYQSRGAAGNGRGGAALRRSVRSSLRADVARVGKQIFDVGHQFERRGKLSLDGLQGFRRGAEPMLCRLPHQIHCAAHPRQHENEYQGGTRAARYVPLVQRFDGSGQHQGKQ